MNNLKKVLALVIVLTMVISTFTVMTASAADFEDVIGTEYEEAVKVLAPMGVIAGYEENGAITFKPSQVVTRAEMAAFIIRGLGLSVASKANTVFKDVPYDFWGSGAISIANSKNIIVGYGDGNFGPDDQVSFQDAVKMLVCALGYEEDAKDNGGYPAGYIAIADKLDVLDGLTDKLADSTAGCDRGTVAKLIYNALDVYLQEVTYYNGQVLSKTITSSTMASEMGYTKFEDVIVNATSTTAFSGSLQDKGYVALEGVKQDVKDGGYDMDQYLGQPVTVYASYDKKNAEYTIVAVLGSNEGDVVVIDAADIYNINGNRLYYYVDKDTSSKTSYYDLAALASDQGNLTMVYNNKAVAAEDQDLDMITSATNGTIKLIDSQKDGTYERVIIETYKNYQVVETDVEENLLSLENASGESNVELDDSKESNRPKFSIVDVAGQKLTLADLAEDDVVSIYSDVYPAEEALGRDYVEDADSLRIVVCNDTIEGAVTSVGNKKVYIDGEGYKTDGVLSVSDFEIDSEGTFYLDFNGDIAFADTEAVLDNFEFVYDGERNNKDITLYAMNSSGEKVSYKVASTVKVNGGTYHRKDNALKIAKLLKIDDSGMKLTEEYVASIKTNESNEVTRITIMKGEADTAAFSKNDKLMGKFVLDSSTVIFTMPKGEAFDEDNLKATKYTTLENNKEYSFVVFNRNKDQVVTAMVVYTEDGAVQANSDIAVIQSVSTTKVDDDLVLSLTMIQGGKVVTKTTKSDDLFFIDSAYKDMYGKSAEIAYGAYPGQIIMYATDSAGAIANTYRLYPRPCLADEYEDGYYLTDKFITWDNTPDKQNNRARLYIAAGKVTKDAKTKTISVAAYNKVKGEDEIVTANYENARITVVDTNMANEELAVKVGSSSDIKNGDYVVVRKNQGTTKDIVVYKNFTAVPAFYEE